MNFADLDRRILIRQPSNVSTSESGQDKWDFIDKLSCWAKVELKEANTQLVDDEIAATVTRIFTVRSNINVSHTDQITYNDEIHSIVSIDITQDRMYKKIIASKII